MTTRAPQGEARGGSMRGKQEQGSPPDGRIATQDAEHDLRWQLRGRLHAVFQELDVQSVDFDVVKTILEGAVESIEAAQ